MFNKTYHQTNNTKVSQRVDINIEKDTPSDAVRYYEELKDKAMDSILFSGNVPVNGLTVRKVYASVENRLGYLGRIYIVVKINDKEHVLSKDVTGKMVEGIGFQEYREYFDSSYDEWCRAGLLDQINILITKEFKVYLDQIFTYRKTDDRAAVMYDQDNDPTPLP